MNNVCFNKNAVKHAIGNIISFYVCNNFMDKTKVLLMLLYNYYKLFVPFFEHKIASGRNKEVEFFTQWPSSEIRC